MCWIGGRLIIDLRIDTDKIRKYLLETSEHRQEIWELLFCTISGSDLLGQPWTLKGLKYALVEIPEAMASNLLAHPCQPRGASEASPASPGKKIMAEVPP